MLTTKSLKNMKNKVTPVQILAIGFAVVILLGGIILTLPISSASGESTNFIDAVFTSTSAVCVTGLVTLDTGTYWSVFGKTVIITLIQIGGLGFMSFTTLIFLLLGKKITLKERMIMQEAMNSFSLQGLVKMVKYVITFTLIVELGGAVVLSFQFIPQFGPVKGVLYSLFHSISAFCNAGFDLMGQFSSLTGYSSNTLILTTISTIIVIGGLGFFVWTDIINYIKKKRMNKHVKLSLHSKIVLTTTAILIVGGTLLMFLFEMNNTNSIADMSIKDKILNSTFAAITPRTAGFNAISTDTMTSAGKFLTTILMFIGGSPGSTAGGLKTVTLAVIIITIITFIRGKEEVELFEKRINKVTVHRSLVIGTICLGLVLLVVMLLAITEPNAPFDMIVYEATSAFATVGLSMGLTPQLSVAGKIIIAITMYFGRVGPLTIALALGSKKLKAPIKYPEDKILVG